MFEKEIKKVLQHHQKKLKIKDLSKIKISLLGQGENNLNILVKVDNKKLNFRINQRPEIEKNVKREFTFLKKLAKGIGPKPFFFDGSKAIIPHIFSIVSYIEGKKIKKWTKRHLQLHAKALKRLHKKKYSYCLHKEKKESSIDIVSHFKGVLKTYPQISKENQIPEITSLMRIFVQSNALLFSNLKQFSIFHGDLNIDNILFSKNSVKYIDWEWGGIGDPASDLVRHFMLVPNTDPGMITLKGERLEYFFEQYGMSKSFRKRVGFWYVYSRYFDLLYCVWAAKHPSKAKFSKEHYQKISNQLKPHLHKKLKLDI